MRSLFTGLILVAMVGCSSNNSTGGSGGAAGASSGGSSSGGSSGSNTGGSNTGGANTGGANTGGSGGTTAGNCATLCSHTDSASPSEVDCVSTQSYLLGYDWPADPVCSTIQTEAQCNTCTVNVAMDDADCASVENSCFNGGSGGSGTGGVGGGTGGIGGIGGIGGVGGGNTGGSGGGSSGGCAALCQHAPTATTAQETCVEVQSYLKGYDWSSEPVCATSDTVPGCNACASTLNMTDADCTAIENTCF